MKEQRTLRSVEPFTNEPKDKKMKFCVNCGNIAAYTAIFMLKVLRSLKDIVILVSRLLSNLEMPKTLKNKYKSGYYRKSNMVCERYKARSGYKRDPIEQDKKICQKIE